MDQQSQQMTGVPGPTGRRFHIAHRRSPSEMTPMIMEQLALQQQIEQLQQQQQHIAGIHQQYVNMGMLPPQQQIPSLNFQPQPALQGQVQMPGMSPAGGAYHFSQQMPGQQLALPMQVGTHRRNQSALPNVNLGGPPPAPSSGSAFGSFSEQSMSPRDGSSMRGGRGGGTHAGAGHTRRHSLALPEAKKAAELAQQKRNAAGFQFPIPGASGAGAAATTPSAPNRSVSPGSVAPDDKSASLNVPQAANRQSGPHGRSQSVALGSGKNMQGRAGGFQFPSPTDSSTTYNPSDASRTGPTASLHGRTPSRNFESNWRQPSISQPQLQEQQPPSAGGFGQSQAPNVGGFQPGHRSRSSVSSIGSMGQFQFPHQPQMMQPPQGQVMMQQPQLYGGQQLSPMQIQQLQSMPQQFNPQALQYNQQTSAQQLQQQRKTLFTPYLPHANLPALLANDQLVAGILRVNKKNRSDAYVTTDDLDADIFICGSKDRNRALEGDLVAIELLNVDDVWSQKREKEEKKKRKDISDARSGGNVASEGRARSNSANQHENAQDENKEGGLRRRGSLRQRPTQKKNDDVEVEGQSLLLMEEEEVNDEQKPLYAGHVVAVIERVSGQMFSGTLGLLRPSSQATKEKQEAERQTREGTGGRQHQERQQDKPKIVWFKPTDKRVPLIAIPTEQAPKDFVEQHQSYMNQIFVASIKRWPITSLHPFGTLVDHLGDMGNLKVETDALLRDNNFGSEDFAEPVLKNIGFESWSVSSENSESLDNRRDLREEQIFTIDPTGSNELDDALHVKKLPNDKVEVGVHVADIAHFIKANSLVDREAKKRGTGVFLVNRTVSMLPSRLAADICSLSPDQDRLAVSVIFEAAVETGEVDETSIWVGKSIIKSKGKVTYDQVDAIIKSNNPCDLPGATIENILLLRSIAEKLRIARYGHQGSNIPALRLIHLLDDENVPVEHNIFNSTPAHEIIEELGFKANAIVARKLFESMPEKAFLRSQAPPNWRRLQTFATRMDRLGYAIDTSSNQTLWDSLYQVKDADLRKGMETLLIKAMRRAKYVIGGRTKPEQQQHYALNLPRYAHFTNPFRRYADIIVHRQLEAALSEDNVSFHEDVESLVKTADSCNNKKDSALSAQEQSVHIDSCRIMDKKRLQCQGDFISEGIVLCVYESAFDVLIPEYGFEKRVHCDQLPLKKAEFRKETRVLELYWEKGVSSSAYVPEDERPQVKGNLRRGGNVGNAGQRQTDSGLEDGNKHDTSGLAASTAGVSLEPAADKRGAPASDPIVNGDRTEQTQNKGSKIDKASFKLRTGESPGDYIQDVTEMTRVPIILKTDLSKSPPCLTVRSVNPYAL